MTVSTKLMTAAELLKLPDDGKRYELIEGVLNEMSPAGTAHGPTAMKVGTILYQFVHQRCLEEVFAAETGFVLSTDPDMIRASDAAFVATDRLPTGELPTGYLRLAPDLVVEVVSPSDAASDLQSKVCMWLDAGWCGSCILSRGRSPSTDPGKTSGCWGEADVLEGSAVFDRVSAKVRDLSR